MCSFTQERLTSRPIMPLKPLSSRTPAMAMLPTDTSLSSASLLWQQHSKGGLFPEGSLLPWFLWHNPWFSSYHFGHDVPVSIPWSIWPLRCSSSSLRHPQISQMPYVQYRSTDMYAPPPLKLEVVWDSEVLIHHHILLALRQNCILHLLAIDSSPPWSMSLPLLPTDMSASFLPFSTKQTESSLKISWMAPFLLISKEQADSSPWPTRPHTLLQVPNTVFFSLFSVH